MGRISVGLQREVREGKDATRGAEAHNEMGAIALEHHEGCVIQSGAHGGCMMQSGAHGGCMIQSGAHGGCMIQSGAHGGCMIQSGAHGGLTQSNREVRGRHGEVRRAGRRRQQPGACKDPPKK
eukprot:364502-Chlamydomonas_euryale.AAC.19